MSTTNINLFKQYMSDTANDVRQKLKTSKKYKINELAAAIQQIPNNGGTYDDLYSTFQYTTHTSDIQNFYNTLSENRKDFSRVYSNSQLKTVQNLSRIKNYEINNMDHMFYNSPNITSITNTDFLRSSEDLENLSYAFGQLYKVQNLDLSNIKNTNATNISGMFYNDNNLQTLNLWENFGATPLDNVSKMFYNCRKLIFDENLKDTFDSSTHFHAGDVRDFSEMFAYCTNLINLPTALNTSNGTNLNGMYRGCENFEGFDSRIIRPINNNAVDLSYMFANCKKFNGYFRFDNPREVLPNLITTENMFANCRSMNQVAYTYEQPTIIEAPNLETTANMFYYCTNLRSSFDLFETGGVLGGYGEFNFPNLKNTAGMFYSCEQYDNPALEDLCSGGKLEDMSNMFAWCGNLSILDISQWNINNLQNAYEAFYYTNHLTSLNLPTAEFNETVNFSSMFGWSGITSLDLSKWNLSKNSHNFKGFANYCRKLETINFGPTAVVNGSNFSEFCYSANSLKSIIINKFVNNFYEGCDCSYMFFGCGKLNITDPNIFSNLGPTNSAFMFADCANIIFSQEGLIKKLHASSANTQDMFRSCNFQNIPNMNWYNMIGYKSNVDASYMFYNAKFKNISSNERWGTNLYNNGNYSYFLSWARISNIDVTNLRVANAKSISHFFTGTRFSNLIGLQYWMDANTNCPDISGLFSAIYYTGLGNYTLNVNGMNVSKVNNFAGVFRDPDYIDKVEGLETWDVSNGTNFANMFYNTMNVTNIDYLNNLSAWDVSKGEDFSGMFASTNTYAIPITNTWNLSNAKSIAGMFKNTPEAVGDVANFFFIRHRNQWENIVNMSSLFSGCTFTSTARAILANNIGIFRCNIGTNYTKEEKKKGDFSSMFSSVTTTLPVHFSMTDIHSNLTNISMGSFMYNTTFNSISFENCDFISEVTSFSSAFSNLCQGSHPVDFTFDKPFNPEANFCNAFLNTTVNRIKVADPDSVEKILDSERELRDVVIAEAFEPWAEDDAVFVGTDFDKKGLNITKRIVIKPEDLGEDQSVRIYAKAWQSAITQEIENGASEHDLKTLTGFRWWIGINGIWEQEHSFALDNAPGGGGIEFIGDPEMDWHLRNYVNTFIDFGYHFDTMPTTAIQETYSTRWYMEDVASGWVAKTLNPQITLEFVPYNNPTCSVSTNNGFVEVIDDEGRTVYTSTNHTSSSSSKSTITFNAKGHHLHLHCINDAEYGKDYGMISQLDKTVANTWDSNNALKVFDNISSAREIDIDYGAIPDGNHTISVAFFKGYRYSSDTETGKYGDSFTFWVTFE